MPAFLDYCRQITDDLRHSWYFRIWLFTWIICAIVSLVAMAYYANTANQNKDSQGLRLFLSEPSSVNFPDFEFKVPAGANFGLTTDLSSSCQFNGQTLSRRYCVNSDGTIVTNYSSCQSFPGSLFAATTVNGARLDQQMNQIVCDIYVTGGSDPSIAFVTEGTDDTVGTNAGSFTYMIPNENIWLLLTQEQLISSSTTEYLWNRVVSYNSATKVPNHFHISLVFNTLEIKVYEGADWFTGWISAGQLGGFVFLVYCIHAAFMALVGIVFTNDSTFLTGVDKYKSQENDSASTAPQDLKPIDPVSVPADSAYGPQV